MDLHSNNVDELYMLHAKVEKHTQARKVINMIVHKKRQTMAAKLFAKKIRRQKLASK
jgi:transposase-like protein